MAQAFDYDLVVIGGGSGGLAASKEAAFTFGVKTALFDFVTPSPQGTTWGLGGTCVNVGCIPKKIMHYSSLIRKEMDDAKHLGWALDKPAFSWNELVDGVGNYIASLNFQYRAALRPPDGNRVEYINAYASLVDAHTVAYVEGKTKANKTLTAKYILIVTGGRPHYPDIPGVKELAISSDDLFSWYKPPGKTLVVGAGYIALECAGFLTEFGFDTTVMVRSVLLRGFDQDIAKQIGEYMAAHGTKFINQATPVKLEQGADQKIVAHYKGADGKVLTDTFDTVVYATGRDPCTKGIGLEALGVKLDRSGKIVVNEQEQTSVPNIFAIGDVTSGRPELTPVAIKAGQLLARRLFGKDTELMDYVNVATTVFTPLEYGTVGYSEDAAIAKFGADAIETYITKFGTLEHAAAHRVDKKEEDAVQSCMCKLVCDRTQKERVIGFHFLGPNAGEVTQGFALAVRLGATKKDFDSLTGIHPTAAEEFTTLTVTKRSGKPIAKSGGC